MTPPMFSVITICLNNKDGLIRTYDSLRSQSCDDYEWIVVDGVSTDGTVEFLKSLPKTDKILWKSEADSGLYDAMNKGMALASGDYLLFMNAGDELADSSILSEVKSAAEKFSFPSLIYGDAYEQVDNGGKILKKAKGESWIWYGMFTHHQSILYKRNRTGGIHYRLEYKLAADYAFTSEFMRLNPSSIYYVSIGICVFEGGGLTSTWQAHVQGMKEQWKVGRAIQGKGAVFSFVTLFLHLLKHAAIRISPSLVRKIRYKKGNQ